MYMYISYIPDGLIGIVVVAAGLVCGVCTQNVYVCTCRRVDMYIYIYVRIWICMWGEYHYRCVADG